MKNTNVTNCTEPVNNLTKDENEIIISEGDYNGLMETVYLTSVPEMKEKLIKGKNTPKEDCVAEEEVE